MAEIDYTVDPESQTIYPGIAPDIGTSQEYVNLPGGDYAVQGYRLVNVDNPTDFYNLGRQGPSTLQLMRNGDIILTNSISQARVNTSSNRHIQYGISTGGDGIDVQLRDGSTMTVSIDFSSVAPIGYRAATWQEVEYVNGREQIRDVVGVQPGGYNSNAALQDATGNPTMRYLRPNEAMERALRGYLANNEEELLLETARRNNEFGGSDAETFSAAVKYMVQGMLTQLRAASQQIIVGD